jgi:hypothetical protein
MTRTTTSSCAGPGRPSPSEGIAQRASARSGRSLLVGSLHVHVKGCGEAASTPICRDAPSLANFGRQRAEEKQTSCPRRQCHVIQYVYRPQPLEPRVCRPRAHRCT